MQIGYARSSTIDQEAGYQAQIKTLTAAGCVKIFAEKVSSVAQRAELDAALEYAREGDALVVTKLDRLARSVAHLVAIGEKLGGKRHFAQSPRPGDRYVHAYGQAHVQYARSHSAVRARAHA
jgi:DNA invertase Pin-like site-specific DNA recombinase